jgi:hypothetical protein
MGKQSGYALRFNGNRFSHDADFKLIDPKVKTKVNINQPIKPLLNRMIKLTLALAALGARRFLPTQRRRLHQPHGLCRLSQYQRRAGGCLG